MAPAAAPTCTPPSRADTRRSVPVRELIARLVDGSRFHEFKPLYGETLVCGFAHIDGWPVAILANDGILFSQSALKGAHFIELACQRRIPLVFLQNITGFMVGREYEAGRHREGRGEARDRRRDRGGAEVHGADRRLVRRRQLRDGRARLPAAVPLDVAELAHLRDGRPAGGARALDGVARRRADGSMGVEAEREAFEAPILETYEREGSPYFATARLWDDGIIDPLDTRRVLSIGLEAALHAPIPDTKFGVFRM